ncbi:MAG: hypothetical protein JW900_10765 [Anaerolineae bacterium]|nr:hypothetical protein [Anaerolineae bacterium]
MPKWKPTLTMLLIVSVLAIAQASPSSAAPPHQDDVAIIVSPTDGTTVSGAVEIVGTVTHPTFTAYSIYYAPGPSPTGGSQWRTIVFQASDPVSNGVLAVWDTTALDENGQPLVPNGAYHLSLVRYRQGSSDPDLQIFVRNITVNNQAATPAPEPTSEPEPLPTSAAATPTPVPIEQPPTPTPRPSPTPAPGETPSAAGEDEDDGIGMAFDTGQLSNIFFDGVKITLLLFGLWGMYVLIKTLVRYFFRLGGFGLFQRKQ